MDLPFHGESTLEYKDLWSLARDIALRVEKGSLLIGWSLGASLALMMAYMFPDRFRGLLLIGACACFFCAWPEKNLRGFMLRLERDRESFLKEFMSLAYPKPFEDSLNLEGAREMLKDYMKLDLRPIQPYIRQRTRIVHGTGDPMAPCRSSVSRWQGREWAGVIAWVGGGVAGVG
ncbi:MAG: alpha/beta fold hydrolase, partial [Aquificaceae bacterium]|nr:alpha/beta fold hydrolase [Aquificaceae bacterium]